MRGRSYYLARSAGGGIGRRAWFLDIPFHSHVDRAASARIRGLSLHMLQQQLKAFSFETSALSTLAPSFVVLLIDSEIWGMSGHWVSYAE